jgi:uncharacterized protein YdaU (DUF1376 family)
MNKKQKDPAFLLYTQDFLTGTYLMTNEQVGKYIRLICLQHQKGHLTTEQMGKLLDDTDAEVLEKFRQDEDGKWYNVRADQEIEKRVRYSEYQSELANRRWNKDAKASANDKPERILKDKPTHKPNECMHAENEDVNEKSLSSIETSSPNHLFTQETLTPVHDSLEDLYNDLN